MVDEKEYWCGKCIKNKIFFAIFMSFPLDKLHWGGGKILLYIHFNEKENRYEKKIPVMQCAVKTVLFKVSLVNLAGLCSVPYSI